MASNGAGSSGGSGGSEEEVTARITRMVYDRYKERADQERTPIKTYFSQLLLDLLRKEEFVSSKLAHLYIDGTYDDHITLKDMKEMTLTNVYLKNEEVYCERDDSTTCIHTRFVWASPRLGRIVASKNGKPKFHRPNAHLMGTEVASFL